MNKNKQKISISLKKAQTHIGKIIKMIDDGEYCIDVMQQNLAVLGLLKSAHQMLMKNHLETCFKKAMASKDEKAKKEMTQEILKITELCNRG